MLLDELFDRKRDRESQLWERHTMRVNAQPLTKQCGDLLYNAILQKEEGRSEIGFMNTIAEEDGTMKVVEAIVVGPALRMVWNTTGRGFGAPGLGPLVNPGHSSTSSKYGATGMNTPVASASYIEM